MGKVDNDDDEEVTTKKKSFLGRSIKIGSIKITYGFMLFVMIVFGVFFIYGKIEDNSKQKEIEERQAEIERRQRLAEANKDTNVETEEERERRHLIERFGEPPEGFMWDDEGDLYSLTSDDKSAEDVLYTFLRAVSMEDFSTGLKYSKRSSIINKYENYYSGEDKDADYYGIFLRKQYKIALQSIEAVSVEDQSVNAKGTTVVTMRVKVLDLTDKDFWKSDQDNLFNNIRNYKRNEEDSTKANQYVYDYLYNSYVSGAVGKREVLVTFTLGKINNQGKENTSGWLVTDDSELLHHLLYEEGVNVAKYISDSYNTWLDEQLDIEEQERQAQEGY